MRYRRHSREVATPVCILAADDLRLLRIQH